MINWKKPNELPLNDNMYKKIVILSYGKFNSGMVHVNTGYWHVYCSDGQWIGTLRDTHLLTEQIIAWTYADEVAQDYLSNETNKEKEEPLQIMKNNEEKTEFTGWSYSYKDDGKGKPASEFIKLNTTPEGTVQYFKNGKLDRQFNNIDEYRLWVRKMFLPKNERCGNVTKGEVAHFPTMSEVFDEMFGNKHCLYSDSFKDIRSMLDCFMNDMEPWEWLSSRKMFPQRWLKNPFMDKEPRYSVKELRNEAKKSVNGIKKSCTSLNDALFNLDKFVDIILDHYILKPEFKNVKFEDYEMEAMRQVVRGELYAILVSEDEQERENKAADTAEQAKKEGPKPELEQEENENIEESYEDTVNQKEPSAATDGKEKVTMTVDDLNMVISKAVKYALDDYKNKTE